MSVHEGVAEGKVALRPFFPSFYVLTCQYGSIVPPHSYIIWGIENRPIGCRNSETAMNNMNNENPKEMGWEGVDCIKLAREKNRVVLL
jgi:hypothetical protein